MGVIVESTSDMLEVMDVDGEQESEEAGEINTVIMDKNM